MNKKVSIVTPTFNEEQNIEKLCLEISKEISKTNYFTTSTTFNSNWHYSKPSNS